MTVGFMVVVGDLRLPCGFVVVVVFVLFGLRFGWFMVLLFCWFGCVWLGFYGCFIGCSLCVLFSCCYVV